MKSKFIETESFSAWQEDNIIYVIYKNIKVDFKVALETVEVITNIADNNAYCYYIDISRLNSISKEAREYLSIARAKEKNLGTAVLAPNVISKLIGTFFVTFNNPGIKFKLFTSEMEAIKWLKNLMDYAG